MKLATQGVRSERLKWLHGAAAKATGTHVVYWMQTSLRSRFNYALNIAISTANALEKPLYVMYTLDTRDAKMSERHMNFLLESLVDVHQSLDTIPLTAVHCTSENGHDPIDFVVAASNNASLVVLDHPYLRDGRKKCTDFVAKTSVPIVQVEGDVAVPVEAVTDKEEYAARTIRPKINKILRQYLIPLPPEDYKYATQEPLRTFKIFGADTKWLDLSHSVETLLESAEDIDRSIPRVSTFTGGETAAQAVLKDFLDNKLLKYGAERNEPSGNGASNLSPYLHYGNISPVDIALQVNATPGRGPAMAASKESFLEELIIRRELSMNFVWFNLNNYDSIASLPPFAAETLKVHAKDNRPYIYTEEELDKAMTRDAYWNAAQLDMIATGKMQNYMRMYWGKKILEWTNSPQEAYKICIALNDKYNLDGYDPNSYAGIAWIFGKHDTGWTERPIFGKVRYMNAEGLKRKYDMTAYINLIKRQCAAAKIPLTLQQLAVDPPKAKKRQKLK
ncbi:hypothetical protein THRCLA_02727 [Thraustotheca clavata]|uniref:Deoxyribodipyrimidine photo-lyase n=1 Tax=Thraustotheca clavata TaxID=74557 RepID=A0A1W0A490_9STRA|nr:hypothetical protein THRCLA_02727 [Thraustotheca clavata]